MKNQLLQNPFFLLQVSIKDNRQEIIKRSGSLLLEVDEDEVAKASTQITILKNRLACELGWFLDLDLSASSFIKEIFEKRDFLFKIDHLLEISQINILEFALKDDNLNLCANEFEQICSSLIFLYENLNLEELKDKINENREVSKFSFIESVGEIEREIEIKKRNCISLILRRFDKFTLVKRIKIMTIIVENETNYAQFQASFMVDDLVDDYKHSVLNLLEDGFKSIKSLIERIIDIKIEHNDIDRVIDRLVIKIKKWNKLARPIQISSKARGISDNLSIELANTIRVAAIEIYNRYNNTEFFEKVSTLLKELFGEFPEILYQVDEDIKSLNQIELKKAQDREFFDSLNYSISVGMLDKDIFNISIGGVSWQGKHYLLDNITLMKWGVYKDQFSGILYSITFGNQSDISIIRTKRSEVYEEIIERFWKMVGMNILSKMLKSFTNGNFLEIENIRIYDEKVVFIPENRSFYWYEIDFYTQDGNFILEAKLDKKFKAALSYQNLYNVYFIETAVKSMYRINGANRLSDVLKS